MDAERERRLVRAAGQGDREAFASLVRTHTPRIYRLALRLVGDPTTAEELVQETMIAAWRGIGGFRGEAAFTTWLTTILVRRHLNLRRHRARRAWWRHLPLGLGGRREEDADTVPELADPGPGPLARLEGGELARRLRAALKELPAGFAEVFLLRESEGMDYATIALALGVAPGTVKSRLSRCRRLLASALGEGQGTLPGRAGGGTP